MHLVILLQHLNIQGNFVLYWIAVSVAVLLAFCSFFELPAIALKY